MIPSAFKLGFGGDLTYEAITSAIRRTAALAGGRWGDRLAAYALAAPDLVVLASRVLRDDRVPRIQRGEILASVVYLASPIDLIPEVLFGPFGLVDDAVVISRLVDLLLNRVDTALVRELWPGDRLVLDTLQRVAAEGRRVFGAGLGPGLRALARRGALAAGRLLRDRLGVNLVLAPSAATVYSTSNPGAGASGTA